MSGKVETDPFLYTGGIAPGGVRYVVVQDGVTEIKPYVFEMGYDEDGYDISNKFLKSIKIPSSVSVIDREAFLAVIT